MDIDCLPDSLLLEVFRHLQFQAICKCSRVCRRWRRVTRDWSLRRVINVTSQPLSALQVWHLVRDNAGANLVELKITGFKTATARGPTAMVFGHLRDHCPSLKVLQLTDAWLERSLADLTTRLTHLSLKRSLFITDVFRDKREPLAVSSLRFLDLANCIFLPWFDMASLTQFHSLRGLVLEGCYPLLATSFAPSRPMITNLVLLNIERIFVCNREVQVVLLQGANLQYLFLGHTGFDGEVFETVWRLLRNQRPLRLTHVCLRCTQIQELHLNKLLQMTPRLQWLAATSADMSPAAKEHVEQYLPSSCQYLEVGPGNPRSAAFCGHSVPL
ncbi:F-box/LRR-repeat protein 12 isoform X3 [Dermacentor silvarum]|uniref:F-box/LRR-repeat protein 12 isoform X2 n=1 Tax=Dermacentor silvarum TaxID=543639 RepID=UPI002100927E|nr:F-box/LRR-repeat protein 12 isoform X2 [Dermacentor silvarum]XP_049514613.1 F-box/LRR-repeat protein 12 isoform X1 [Dermacentor silvarum]XP_049514628.1 F-box/LRR-repeat protein 12 isoform X3 [Dermacentor silvarum]